MACAWVFWAFKYVDAFQANFFEESCLLFGVGWTLTTFQDLANLLPTKKKEREGERKKAGPVSVIFRFSFFLFLLMKEKLGRKRERKKKLFFVIFFLCQKKSEILLSLSLSLPL